MLLLSTIAQENGVPLLPLSVSRRPTKPLLAVLNSLFGAMSDRYPELGEPLESAEGTAEPRDALAPLTFISVDGRSREDRIAATATWIREVVGQPIDDVVAGQLRSVGPGDIAILVRSNAIVRDYKEGLGRRLAGTDIQV